MSLDNCIKILVKYYPSFLLGIRTTLIVALSGTLIGLCIGLLVGGARAIKLDKTASGFNKTAKKIIDLILKVYIEVFRGTPMMVQALIFYYFGFNLFKKTNMTVTEINQVWSFFISGSS